MYLNVFASIIMMMMMTLLGVEAGTDPYGTVKEGLASQCYCHTYYSVDINAKGTEYVCNWFINQGTNVEKKPLACKSTKGPAIDVKTFDAGCINQADQDWFDQNGVNNDVGNPIYNYPNNYAMSHCWT